MRISDKERREIAGKLRNLKPKDASDDFFASFILFETMGFKYWTKTAYDNGIEDSGLTKTGLYKLADLIDRPTCHLIEDEDGRTACSECGCAALCLSGAEYCPDCGRVIVGD